MLYSKPTPMQLKCSPKMDAQEGQHFTLSTWTVCFHLMGLTIFFIPLPLCMPFKSLKQFEIMKNCGLTSAENFMTVCLKNTFLS